MGKIHRKNKVVILLNGRHAGRKAVILRSFEEGTPERPFPHCLVAGIEKYPRKVIKKMGRSKVISRSKVTAFVKFINMAHLIITRYTIDISFADLAKRDFKDGDVRAEAKQKIGGLFTRRYLVGAQRDGKQAVGVDFFFKKLLF